MTVYVDDMEMQATVGTVVGRWSHLQATSTEELVRFARRLGLRDEWIQCPGTYKEHYDLTGNKRREAIRLGARPIGYGREGAALMEAKREGRVFDLDAYRLAHPPEDAEQGALF